MPVICPTCQIFSDRSTAAGLLRRFALRNDETVAPLKKPATNFPARALNSCDDEDMPVICPTCQIFWFVRRRLNCFIALLFAMTKPRLDRKSPRPVSRRGL
jgi:hypothetical protein